MPQHSAFYWGLYLAWTVGFGVTGLWILGALREAVGDLRQAVRSGRNGLLLVEARRAVRLEAVRLAQAAVFAPLGVWAIFSPDPRLSPRGLATQVLFLLCGALVCSQTWFDQIDRARAMGLR
jgi:hypothetical protein